MDPDAKKAAGVLTVVLQSRTPAPASTNPMVRHARCSGTCVMRCSAEERYTKVGASAETRQARTLNVKMESVSSRSSQECSHRIAQLHQEKCVYGYR